MAQGSGEPADVISAAFSGQINVLDSKDMCKYFMGHARRGMFIIINNKTFARETMMQERTGTDVDAAQLQTLFRSLRFDVQLHNNQTTQQMLRLMQDAAGQDHSNCDCIGVAVLSHGDQGIAYGVDAIIEIDRLIQPLKYCKSLAGKPKLFFFQMCRGTGLDSGIEVASDGAPEGPRNIARIPIEADFLYAFSAAAGYFSWRNQAKGSWFVQALWKVFQEESAGKLELCQLLTRVNHTVAYDFKSDSFDPSMRNKKQVPSIVSMLTKELYFTNT